MNKKYKTIGLLLIIVLSTILVSGCTGGSGESETKLDVTEVSVAPAGYGMYNVKATLIPDKDYSYLGMVAIFYDKDGAVIGTSPLVWNMNNVKEGQTIKINGNAFLSSSSESPAKIEIGLFSSAFSGNDMSSALWTETIDL